MTETTTCAWLRRTWIIFSLLWLGFIAYRTFEAWPTLPLDMGGVDPATDAAYQAAQLQHAAMALGLAIAAPLITRLLLKIACRARRH